MHGSFFNYALVFSVIMYVCITLFRADYAAHARRRQTRVDLSYTFQQETSCGGLLRLLAFILATLAFLHPYFKSQRLASFVVLPLLFLMKSHICLSCTQK